MASTNLQVVFVNTKLPEKRSSNYERITEKDNVGGIEINQVEGKFKRRESIFDKNELIPEQLEKLTPGQLATNYVLATPTPTISLRKNYNRQEEIPNSDVVLAQSNDDRNETELFLPEKILLRNGRFMTRVKKPFVLDIPKLTPIHEKQYSDLLLYNHCNSEEADLGEAARDEIICARLHAQTDRNPQRRNDGTPMSKIETVKARMNSP